MATRNKDREVHHLIGMKDGKAEGCAHSDTELRNYINFGRISNSDCPAIRRWNKPTNKIEGESVNGK